MAAPAEQEGPDPHDLSAASRGSGGQEVRGGDSHSPHSTASGATKPALPQSRGGSGIWLSPTRSRDTPSLAPLLFPPLPWAPHSRPDGGGGGFPYSVSGTDGETEAGRLPPRPEACKAPTAPPAGLSHRTSRQAHLLSLSLPRCGPSSRGPAQPAPSPHLCMAVPSPQHDLGLLWTDPNFILGRNLGRQPPRPLSVPQPWELRARGGGGCGRRTWAPVAPTSQSVHGASQRAGSA